MRGWERVFAMKVERWEIAVEIENFQQYSQKAVDSLS
jgi:hypothetical protein